MKRILLFTLALSLQFTLLSQNQDWHPIRTDDSYYYMSGDEYRAYRIDSIVQHENEQILFSFHELFAQNLADCYNPYGPSWIGEKFMITDTSILIVNLYNEIIFFPKHLTLNATWTLFENDEAGKIDAQVIKKTYENIGFTSDSVFTIQLQSNGELNNTELKISKNNGFVECYNFLLFPDYATEFEELRKFYLTGKESNPNSDANITLHDIYNFDISDEFHVYYESGYFDEPNYDISKKKEIIKVENKKYINDSNQVVYNFSVCSSNAGKFNKTDTINFVNKLFETPPFVFYLYGEYENKTPVLYLENGVKCKLFGTGLEKDTDSCYHFLFIDKKSQEYNTHFFPMYSDKYYKGLGGPYYNHAFMFSHNKKELVYYKKGDTTWGTPYNCDSIMSAPESTTESSIKVFPNPVTSMLTVDLPSPLGEAFIEIYNILGEQLLSRELSQKTNTITLEDYNKGTLFYKITRGSELLKTGVLIKN